MTPSTVRRSGISVRLCHLAAEAGDHTAYAVVLRGMSSHALDLGHCRAARCRFLALRDRVLPRASREQHRYLTDLGHGLRGNIEWGLRVPRYLSLNGAAAGPGEVEPPGHIPWADRPANTGEEPPPLLSIAWWWGDVIF